VEGAEDKVAGEGGVDGDLGGFQIADFTDHDDVGGLAQHGAQGGGEGHADVGVDGNLVDAGELVFDRVFNGDDLAVGLVDVVETGVKSGGLAGTGRAGDEEDSVGQSEDAFHDDLVVGEEAEFGQAEHEAGFIQNTHDDALAVVGGNGGDTQVDAGFFADAQLDASVLGHALFGDAHVGHDFDAADDGGLEFFGADPA